MEAGDARSIDHVIRKITQITPKDSKKKTTLVDQQNLEALDADTNTDSATESSTAENLPEPQIIVEEIFEPSTLPNPSSEDPTESSNSGSLKVPNEKSTISAIKEEAAATPTNLEKNSLQSTDPELIKQRMEALPKAVREVVDLNFQRRVFRH